MTDAIELYWRPGCGFCMMLRPQVHQAGLPVREFNIWEDADAAARVRTVADGNEVVPTVIVGDHALVNPSIADVVSAVAEHAPSLLPAD